MKNHELFIEFFIQRFSAACMCITLSFARACKRFFHFFFFIALPHVLSFLETVLSVYERPGSRLLHAFFPSVNEYVPAAIISLDRQTFYRTTSLIPPRRTFRSYMYMYTYITLINLKFGNRGWSSILCCLLKDGVSMKNLRPGRTFPFTNVQQRQLSDHLFVLKINVMKLLVHQQTLRVHGEAAPKQGWRHLPSHTLSFPSGNTREMQ